MAAEARTENLFPTDLTVKFNFVLQLLLGLRSIFLTSLYSLFYITGECYRLLH